MHTIKALDTGATLTPRRNFSGGENEIIQFIPSLFLILHSNVSVLPILNISVKYFPGRIKISASHFVCPLELPENFSVF
jgi:hypothetical protein